MGCDGGSIPKRDEMVKLKKKAEKVDKAIELAAKWRHCALSSEKLQQPVVSCELGRLYNKETVLMTLLDKTNIPDIASHLRSLKDIVVLQLTPNPEYKPNDKADAYHDLQTAEFICPVTGLHMNGQNRFIFFRQCGCVISEKGMKEVPSAVCHKCGKPFVKDDVIIINGNDEELEKQRLAMEERREALRLAKRKRKANHVESSVASGSSLPDSSVSMETSTPSTDSSHSSSSSSQITSTSSASVQDELPADKKTKVVPQPKPKAPVVKSTRPKMSAKPATTAKAKEDGKGLEKRDAYKSLFTSSVPARPKEQTSHWVTFFPYH